MSLKLRFASIWMPEYVLKKEIDHVASVTIECLDSLLLKYAPEKLKVISRKDREMKGDIEKRRKIMATAHNLRVEFLIDELGCDEAVRVGRDALFRAGIKLGRQARERLNVGDSFPDLIMAARILYRVLGIDFEIEKCEEEIIMTVNRCSLSNYYLPETCRILSAADEGVVQGLNPNIHMKFVKRITQGHDHCLASIKMNHPLKSSK